MNFQLSLELPDTIQASQEDVKMIMIYALFEKGILTSGQAAKIVGVSKRVFLENAYRYGVTVFQYDDNELGEEIAQWQ